MTNKQLQHILCEDLDLSSFGLYLESQIDHEQRDDYFLSGYLSLGRPLYMKHSDEGVKRFTYEDKGVDYES